MSEVKFTKQELQSIQDLSTKSNGITNRFGQLAIAKINLEKQSETVEEEEFKLHEELENLKKEVTEQSAGLERNFPDIKYKATCKYLNFQEAISVK